MLKAKLKSIPVAAAINARWKSWSVEQSSAVMRRRYGEYIRDHGLAVPAGQALQAAVRKRVADRATRLKWPRPLGDHHIFLAYSLSNWEAVLPKAMAEFGEVSAFEWRSKGFDAAAPEWLQRRIDMNREMIAAFDAANRRRPVDLVVGYLSGANVSPETLQYMATGGAIITNFCLDDKIAWPGRTWGGRFTSTAAIAHVVDLNLTSDPNGAVRYFAHGGLAMFHPEAADPDWYRPLDAPFEYSVSFVGACYGWRPKLIAELRRRGIDVTCFGKGWPNGGVDCNRMVEIYARSRVNLGCGGIGYSRKLLCLKGRDFEVPMSGALYLTQDNPELSLVFDVGREILTYRNAEECARIIHELLKDERRAALIRKAARARCLADHTYQVRWRKVFDVLGALSGRP